MGLFGVVVLVVLVNFVIAKCFAVGLVVCFVVFCSALLYAELL